jgi:hypothetical protein
MAITTAPQALALLSKMQQNLRYRVDGNEAKGDRGIVNLFSYFDGQHPLLFASPQWRAVHEDRFKGFSDNWCLPIGQAPVDRLRIDGFRLGSDDEKLSTMEQELWTDWNVNEMTAQSNQGFQCSTVARRSFTYVWGDTNGKPKVFWEHPSQVIVEYDPMTREPAAALKIFRDEELELAFLQTPQNLWKFQRKAGVQVANGRTPSGLIVQGFELALQSGWKPYQPSTDDVWPLKNPVGEVTFVEWPNRPRLDGMPRSDIEGAIAMQNAINLLWAYLFAAADYASMPARLVMGEPPKIPILNDEGEVIGTKPARLEDIAQGRLLFLPGAESTASWDAADLEVFTKVMAEGIAHLASQTSTPGHYLLMNTAFSNLNADALTAAEVPLATKVGTQQMHYAPSAKKTARLMRLIRNDKAGAQAIAEMDSREFTQWKDAAMHSDAQVADAATKDRSIGISLRSILQKRYNWTDAEIDREMDRIQAEKNDGFDQAVIDGFSALLKDAPMDPTLAATPPEGLGAPAQPAAV